MNEKDNIEKAVNVLKTLFKELNIDFNYDLNRMNQRDMMADIYATIRYKKKEYSLFIEVKFSGQPRSVEQFIGYFQNNKTNEYPIFMAPYLSESGRNLCIQNKINYVDFSGNAFIKIDEILIDRWGRENKFKQKRILKSMFSSKATWVIRRLLNEPKKSWKLQELANESFVSIGQVYKVIDKLDEQGLIRREWGSVKLIKPGELLDSWASIYQINDLVMTGYYCPFEKREKLFNLLRSVERQKYALTLGAGASVIAPFVRSTDTHLYTPSSDFFIMLLELTPVEFGGNVYLIEPPDDGYLMFPQKKQGLEIVSNVQLYLDLYKYPKRGVEQADFLRENALRY